MKNKMDNLQFWS